MRIDVLGPLEVDEGRIVLAPRDQVVLEALAARPGETVRAEALAEALWGERPPPSWPKVVQGCVSRLRKALGTAAIVTSGGGYRLAMHRDDFDHLCFEDLLLRASELLATGEPERARYASGQALGLWRGDPLERLSEWESGRIESERLSERRHDAEDLYADAAIRTGRHGEVLGDLHRMVAQQPTRERRWGLLAMAQYQDGRQAEALGTLQRARSTLVNEFGLDPGHQLAELEEAILRQDPALVTANALPMPKALCPYLGLVAYDVGDAPAYFGREADVSACLGRLDATGVLAVVGPSGSGKSSLIRAGVAAALVRDGNQVQIVTPGPHPEDVLPQAPTGNGAVFVVDQCEEALALAETSPERAELFAGLVGFATRGRLVISLRADRLGELAAHPEFAHLVEQGLYLLGGMNEAQLRSAIEGPAAQAGLRLEPGLVDLLVRETESSPGALPLLSHVLRQTWRRREGDTLTVQGYAATGGVRAAVARSAERLYLELTPTQQGMLRDLMVRLVSSDTTGEPVRTRVARRTVASDDEHKIVVERLLGARLLSSDGENFEIAHESLALAWPRLRSWLDEDVDGLRILRHLTVAAETWDQLGRPDSELYRGVRQARAAEWQGRAGAALTDIEREFLRASADLAGKEQRATESQVRRERRLNSRLRVGLGAVAALLAVAVMAGALAFTAADRADQSATEAARQALAADARRLGAEALRSEDPDRSLLLAAAAVTLDDSADTRSNLLATLDRAPALAGTAHSAGHILGLAVDTVADRVAVAAADGDGFELYDGQSLRKLTLPERIRAGSVFANPDGRGYAISVPADLVDAGVEPAVLLLDPDGARSEVQLGGIPQGYQVYDNFGFDPSSRWNMGYSAQGRWFAVALRDIQGNKGDLMVVWDLRSPAHPMANFELADNKTPVVSGDGRTLYTTPIGGGLLVVTDLPGGTPRQVVAPQDLGVRQLDDVLVASPDGETLAVGAGVEIVLVDAATISARAYLSGQGATSAIAFSPDGTRVAATGDRLKVWEVSGADPVVLLTQDGSLDAPQFGGDGKTVYTKTFAGALDAWDLAGDRRFIPTHPGDHLTWTEGFDRISPDGRKVAYVQLGPRFRVRDLETGELGPLVSSPMAQGSYIDVAWHPDSTILNMTSGDPVVRTWDSRTGQQIAEHRLTPAPSAEGAAIAHFSVDGTYLLVGTTTGRIHVLDAHTLVPARRPIQVYLPADVPTNSRAVFDFSPSGDLRTVYLNDRIVDYVTGIVREWPDLGVEITARYPSPDGKRLLIGSDGGTGLLDATTMRWISRPSAAQTALVGGVAKFSDDGALMASMSNGRLSHWDGRTGTYLGGVTVEWDGDPAFTDGNSRLIFAGESGTVVSWDLDPSSWIATACRLAGRPLTEQEWRNYLPNRPFEPICAS